MYDGKNNYIKNANSFFKKTQQFLFSTSYFVADRGGPGRNRTRDQGIMSPLL